MTFEDFLVFWLCWYLTSVDCVVYWLYNEQCVDPWRDGYIGISTNLPRRIIRHRNDAKNKHNPLIPLKFDRKILLSGTLVDCLMLEYQMRPEPSIGWNRARGGRLDGSMLAGTRHSKQHSERIRIATLKRYARPGEKEKTIAAVKAAFKNVNRSGSNNAMFGKRQSESTKHKIGLTQSRRLRGNLTKAGQLDFDL